jgi:hypothetical protein
VETAVEEALDMAVVMEETEVVDTVLVVFVCVPNVGLK